MGLASISKIQPSGKAHQDAVSGLVEDSIFQISSALSQVLYLTVNEKNLDGAVADGRGAADHERRIILARCLSEE